MARTEVGLGKRWVLCVALLLAACGAPKPQPESALPAGINGTAQFPAADPVPGPGVYRIDAARSALRLLVYRAGSLSRLGHNHVISHGALGGWVKYSGNLAEASFVLRAPVAAFVVDDAAMRGEEGADFAAEVPEDAKGGTKQNMLSEAMLDAAHFPSITLSSVALSQVPASAAVNATLTVTVAGHVSTLVVPFVLVDDGRGLLATGSMKLRQSELGLVPFSVMLGALQVQDEFTVKFELRAVAT